MKFEKGTDNEQRARLSDAPLALRSDDLRVAAKAVAVDVGCGEVRSWCAVVMVDELGEEWTDEKLCRVTEDVPTKVCLKEEEWRTLWTAPARSLRPPISVGFLPSLLAS